MYSNFKFEYTRYSGQKRIGTIFTPHGQIETPAFIFCGTKASVKAVTIEQLEQAKTQIILSNTYHMMLQPGEDVVANIGGLHKFMGWNKPIFTDSGGFQIFSLGHGSVADEIKGKRDNSRNKSLLKITDEGAIFSSYINGKKYFLTPQKSIDVQSKLGADIIVALDECTPFHVDKNYTKKSMELSHNWEKKSLEHFKNINNGAQALYGIIQGGVYNDLRQISCDFVNNEDFFGHAIGGSLGANKNQMYDIVSYSMSLLDQSRPVHLLGIGGIVDIFAAIEYGVDTFDCVHPTRIARHGGALIKKSSRKNSYNYVEDHKREHINLNNSYYRTNSDPIDKECGCYTCKNFSTSYIHHLIKAKEILSTTLITIHNIYFMNKLFSDIRLAIKSDNIKELKEQYI